MKRGAIHKSEWTSERLLVAFAIGGSAGLVLVDSGPCRSRKRAFSARGDLLYRKVASLPAHVRPFNHRLSLLSELRGGRPFLPLPITRSQESRRDGRGRALQMADQFRRQG